MCQIGQWEVLKVSLHQCPSNTLRSQPLFNYRFSELVEQEVRDVAAYAVVSRGGSIHIFLPPAAILRPPGQGDGRWDSYFDVAGSEIRSTTQWGSVRLRPSYFALCVSSARTGPVEAVQVVGHQWTGRKGAETLVAETGICWPML